MVYADGFMKNGRMTENLTPFGYLSDAFRMSFGCLSDVFRIPFGYLSDAFRMSFGCLSDVFRMPFGCLSDAFVFPDIITDHFREKEKAE